MYQSRVEILQVHAEGRQGFGHRPEERPLARLPAHLVRRGTQENNLERAGNETSPSEYAVKGERRGPTSSSAGPLRVGLECLPDFLRASTEVAVSSLATGTRGDA